MRLPATATAGQATMGTSTITFLHAKMDLYLPAPTGGSYVMHVQCTHKHEDSRKGYEEMTECGERLQRIIRREHRLPKWAELDGTLPADALQTEEEAEAARLALQERINAGGSL